MHKNNADMLRFWHLQGSTQALPPSTQPLPSNYLRRTGQKGLPTVWGNTSAEELQNARNSQLSDSVLDFPSSLFCFLFFRAGLQKAKKKKGRTKVLAGEWLVTWKRFCQAIRPSHPHHSQSGWQLNRASHTPQPQPAHVHGYIVFINPSISWQILSCHRLSASTVSVWVRQTNGKGIRQKQQPESASCKLGSDRGGKKNGKFPAK